MNSLLNYGSDDDCDDSPEEKPMDLYPSGRNHRKSWTMKQDDANYDEVQMSLSEDSGDESKASKEPQRRQHWRDDGHRESARRWDVRDSPKPRDEPARSQKEKREERYAPKNEREEDRSKQREDSKEDDRTRERYRAAEKEEEQRSRDRRDEKRGKSRERYPRDERYRDRKDRDKRRSRSPRDRERRRSRSPRRDRSRSRSRDRGGRGGYSKRYDRGNKDRFDRNDQQKNDEKTENKDRFFVPGITGRFREQIEKRKLLWQKKEPETVQPQLMGAPSMLPSGSRITKVWEATTFAQDTDGKVANKFKRLMGIKNVGEGSNVATDVLKKQEEMFSSMEQQYEVARTATHTMRGVGLGFGSYQR